MTFKRTIVLVVAHSLALLGGAGVQAHRSFVTSEVSSADSVVYSFVSVGCNRVDKKDTNFSVNPSTANVAQLKRTLDDIAKLEPKPKFLFFTGDAILGYTDDSVKLLGELAAWRDIWEHSSCKAAGIELVPIPGNHESQNSSKVATPFAERAWLRVMSPYIKHGGNGPAPRQNDPDSLLTDQRDFTYSFDFEGSHFLVISTDPAGRDWRPPVHWIASDLTAAHANSTTRHIFAFGHKPAYEYNYDSELGEKYDGLAKYPEHRDMLWKAFEDSHVDAMITAHNHIYRAFQPTGKTWMVIAGNGGSKLEKESTPAQRFYGFTLIQVLKNGTVVEKTYGRDFADSYTAESSPDKYPTTIRDSKIISWK
jgi:hypothetical protein